jgi:hypothetical protein
MNPFSLLNMNYLIILKSTSDEDKINFWVLLAGHLVKMIIMMILLYETEDVC